MCCKMVLAGNSRFCVGRLRLWGKRGGMFLKQSWKPTDMNSANFINKQQQKKVGFSKHSYTFEIP